MPIKYKSNVSKVKTIPVAKAAPLLPKIGINIKFKNMFNDTPKNIIKEK